MEAKVDPKFLEPNAVSADPIDWTLYTDRWDALWVNGIKPGEMFDAGRSSGVLVDLLQRQGVEVAGKRTLVPGCGRGYDVVQLAIHGARDSAGLEVSSKAVDEAREYLTSVTVPVDKEKMRIVEGDFFTYNDPQGPFDVGYDYTFFCAMHPSMRATWAASWGRLLAPGGVLITLMYPIDPLKDPNVGPPYAVTSDLYQQFLSEAGFVCEQLGPAPTELSHPARAGKEWLGVWRRK